MHARGLVDVLVPRGGADLIQTVVRESTVPAIETGVGNCHVYVDESADIAMARRIIMNSKVQRPGVCNAAETLLVHRAIAAAFLPLAARDLVEAGVTLHADDDAARLAGVATVPAGEEDWATEYLSLDLAVRVVDDLDAAIEHVRTWSSGPHGGDRDVVDSRRAGRSTPGTGRGRAHRERLHAVHRRRPVRPGRRDRHLHPEAARPRADGPQRAHDDVLARGG